MRKHARSLIRHDSFERSRILHGLCAGKVYSALRGHYLDRPPVRGDGRLSLPDANAIWLKTWRIEVLAGKGVAAVCHYCPAISSRTLIPDKDLSHETSDTINVTRKRLRIYQIHSQLHIFNRLFITIRWQWWITFFYQGSSIDIQHFNCFPRQLCHRTKRLCYTAPIL